MTVLESLENLLVDEHAFAGTHALAYRMHGALPWSEFIGQVEVWQSRLHSVGEPHIAIYLPAVEDFLACIWATWRLGKIAVISSNAFRDVQELSPHHAQFAQAVRLQEGFAVGIPMSQQHESPALLLFTSGSSGVPQVVAKSFRQLDAELALLESLWGSTVDGSVFASTVSHHHMFGLPFALLWPLVRGSAFYAGTIHYAESLEELARRHRITVVTSPVQLDNLPAALDWPLLQTQTAKIFSAGAALAPQTAKACLGYFARPVTEIYGSTETGAVAWREQPEHTLWQCLPSVQVQCEQDTLQLRINSPAIGTDTGQWLTVADTGTVHSPQRFELLGRTDRIVKVGGKRISLTAIERALQTHPWVEQAKVVLLAARKSRLGAVVVLGSEGKDTLIDQSKHAINRLLTQHIASGFDRVALPRYWRFVSKMPTDTQGKTTNAALNDLFDDQQQPTLPQLINDEEIIEGEHRRLSLWVPDNLYFFSGHFPGNPVLPGVVQIHWAIHYGRQYFPGQDVFVRLEVVKFQHIIQAGCLLTLDLHWDADSKKMQFIFSSPRSAHSSGRIAYKTDE